MRIAVLLAVLLLSGAAFSAAPPRASADGPDLITVTTIGSGALTVNGAVLDQLPAAVSAGSEVCVKDSLSYVTEVERWVFQRWEHGPVDKCVTLVSAGSYRALYEKQVQIQVRSVVPTERQTLWLAIGAPVEFDVTELVPILDRVRYRFVEWSAGETPFKTQNVFVPLKPTVLEARRVKEYLVTVEGPEQVNVAGTGWYLEGTDVFVQAPETIDLEQSGERLAFSRWTSDAFPPLTFSNPDSPLASFKVNGTFVVRPEYKRQFLVQATSPMGNLKRDWVTVGGRIEIEAPAIIDIIPEQERFSFVRWDGQEGLTAPRIAGVINSPVTLAALYQRQVKITLEAPYGGAGGGWYPVGTTVTITVPRSAQDKLVFVNRFKEFSGLGVSRPSTQLVAQSPVTLAAVYESQVNLGILILLAIVPLSALGMYLAYRWLVVHSESRTFRY